MTAGPDTGRGDGVRFRPVYRPPRRAASHRSAPGATVLSLLLIVLGGCGDGGGGSAGDVEAMAEELEEIAAAVHEAWYAKSPEAIRALYTADVAHNDDSSLNHIEGIDGIVALASGIFPALPDGGTFDAPTYVGGDAGAVVSGTRGVVGIFYAEGEAPPPEVDVYGIRDGLIETWDVFFIHDEFADDDALPTRYAAAWSSGDRAAVEALYASDAGRTDGVFGEQAEGRDAIGSAASAFFEAHTGATWQLTAGMGDKGIYTDPVARGGVYTITADGCAVGAVVALDVGDEGIVAESVFYDAASLISCGWVG